jgi:hypothetical protein
MHTDRRNNSELPANEPHCNFILSYSSMNRPIQNAERFMRLAAIAAVCVTAFFGPFVHQHDHSAAHLQCRISSDAVGCHVFQTPSCSCRYHQTEAADSESSAAGQASPTADPGSDNDHSPCHDNHNCRICLILAQPATQPVLIRTTEQESFVQFLPIRDEFPAILSVCPAVARGPQFA